VPATAHSVIARRRSAIAATLLCFALLTWARPALAEPTAVVRTLASAPVPPGIAIAVSVTDATARAGRLQPLLEAWLREAGHGIDAASPWRLQVTLAVTPLRRDGSGVRVLGSLGSESRADVGVELPLPQWPGAGGASGRFRYNVAMTLGQAGRPAIWQGAATTLRDEADDLATERRLARLILARLGRSTGEEPVALPAD
jgi:hypothetical protein